MLVSFVLVLEIKYLLAGCALATFNYSIFLLLLLLMLFGVFLLKEFYEVKVIPKKLNIVALNE